MKMAVPVRRFLDWIVPVEGSSADVWRRRVFAAAMLGLVFFTLIAYVPGVIVAAQNGRQEVVLFDTLVYGSLIVVMFARRAPFTLRVSIVAALPFALGAYLLGRYGLRTAGMLWMLSFPIFSATLLGRRAAIVATSILVLFLVWLGVMRGTGQLDWPDGDRLAVYVVIASSLSFLAGVLSLSISVLFDGLASESLAREAAEQASSRLARAINQSDGYVLLLSLDGVVTYANEAMHRRLAGAPPFLAQAPWVTVAAGTPWAGSCDWTGADGSVTPMSGVISPVRDELGRITHLLATLRDVGHERTLEAQLQQGQRLAAIGTLAGGIAHDFNNLLQPILGNTETALARLPADAPERPLLEDVRQSADRARALVRRILSFTRAEPQLRHALDLGKLVAETERLLRATLPSSITMACDVEADVWVMAEPGELQQVLLNLATNAAHAMPHGGALRLVVETIATAQDAVLAGHFTGAERVARLVVEDNGVGMDETTLSRAFEPFFTTKPPATGTGLGLAMVHATVSALGGIIVPVSTPGQGTSIRVLLPLTTVAHAETETDTSDSVRIQRRRVLVVDDEPSVLAASARVLERLGWVVVAEPDAARAVARLRAPEPDVDCVLTDLSMPAMTGTALAAMVKTVHPQMPVVLMTGFLDHELSDDDRAHVHHVVQKPFTAAELRDVMEDVRRMLV
jgi:signal transduction histidine kinase/CheY-like chemotaxis protein